MSWIVVLTAPTSEARDLDGTPEEAGALEVSNFEGALALEGTNFRVLGIVPPLLSADVACQDIGEIADRRRGLARAAGEISKTAGDFPGSGGDRVVGRGHGVARRCATGTDVVQPRLNLEPHILCGR